MFLTREYFLLPLKASIKRSQIINQDPSRGKIGDCGDDEKEVIG